LNSKRNRSHYLLSIFILLTAFIAFNLIKIKFDHSSNLITIQSLSHSSSLGSSSTCINCHGSLVGFSPSHAEIGCVACHQGNNENSDKDSSHLTMIPIPGNMSDADETCGLCHPQALSDIKTSLMSSNSGIIAIDRYIFGESDSPNLMTHIQDLGHSAADEHVRNLCSHCHIGNEKTETGPIHEKSRGGGCNACHLNYSDKAKNEHEAFKHTKLLGNTHPSLDLNVSDAHCFGCHSRSGRIATNYEGWHETLLSSDKVVNNKGFRVLEDGRVFRFVAEDVHHSIGLQCIDCHNYEDVMGDGIAYAHEEEAVKISCEDCHFTGLPPTSLLEDLGFTQKRILALRGYAHESEAFLLTHKDSTALLNTYLDEDQKAFLVRKSDRTIFEMSQPSESCNRDAGHQKISCSACHSNWAPQCIGCHTNYDPKAEGYDLYEGKYKEGSWIEFSADFLADAPVLGIRGDREIQPAIPGMIMTLDQSAFSEENRHSEASFHRLFSPVSPHTTSAVGRSCTSCHSDPLAIGYGRGKLRFHKNSNPPFWDFIAEYEDLEDGIPSDAWIAFLEEPSADRFSTRLDFKPFSLESQKRILTIGACFTCHREDSEIMKNSLTLPFEEYKKRMSSRCRVPVFSLRDPFKNSF
jgi:hypothetical protein